MDPSSPIDIALRVYAEPQTKKRRAREAKGATPWRPTAVLFLDCETTIDKAQRLNFGFYRYCRIRWNGAVPDLTCVEEGLFYADDLPARDPDGFACLEAFASGSLADVTGRGQLRVRSQDEFLYRVLYMGAYRKRAVVCGFNLPFDLSRLARHAGAARSSRKRGDGDDAPSATYRGGFSFVYWGREREGKWHDRPSMPRIAINSLDSKRALIGFVPPKGGSWFPGEFLDLRTLSFALTDASHSLGSACTAFGVQHGKLRTERHGVIDRAYVGYARRDVLATSELFVAAITEYLRHPIDLPSTKAFSPAAIGKAYLAAMGVSPILKRQPDFPKDVLGIAMQAYVGGRAECRIRKEAVPVRYCDFRSMYPTVCALLGVWPLLTAERIEVCDATAKVRQMLSEVNPSAVFEQSFWKSLVGFAEIETNDDVIPVRGQYSLRPGWSIGVNPVRPGHRQWISIPDAVASTLLTGRPPKVLRAIVLVPKGRLPGLQPAALGGTIPIDPRTTDFFRAVIERRADVLSSAEMDEAERVGLGRFLKTLANATSYGIFAEQNRRQLPERETEKVTVHLPDRTFETTTSAPEDLGRYFFPPIAAVITGAARLMLALLERSVVDAGGTYAMVDTDSMAIVASARGDQSAAIPRLSWADVDEIRARFRRLSPYDPSIVPDLLKLEDENLDERGQPRELECFAISAKRYALFVRDGRGEPVIVKASEHGLGHLLDPTGNVDDSKAWMRQTWLWIIRRELGLPAPVPKWFALPAVGEVPVSSPVMRRPFTDLNRGQSYDESIKPFNFVLAAHVLPFGHPSGVEPERFQLVAPFEKDPAKWLDLPWIDRYSGRRYEITTRGTTGGMGVARVKSYGDVVAEYRVHTEGKSLAPDGSPCRPRSRGLLLRRSVAVGARRYIGKEANEIDARHSGLHHDLARVLETLDEPESSPWPELLRNVLTASLAAATGHSRSTVKRWKRGTVVPRRRNQRILETVIQRTRASASGETVLSGRHEVRKRTIVAPASILGAASEKPVGADGESRVRPNMEAMVVVRVSPALTDAQATTIEAIEEGQYIDIKAIELKPAKLTESLSAFANADGGEVYLGVDEQIQDGKRTRQIRGFAAQEDANNHIAVCDDSFPLGQGVDYEFIPSESGQRGFLLRISVAKSKDVKKASDDQVYIRKSAQNLKVVGLEAMTVLQRNKGISSYENETVNAPLDVVTNSTTTLQFMLDVIPFNEPEPWLRKQSLIQGDKPTVGAVLLFAEEPQAHIAKAAIKVYRYKTTNPIGTRDELAGDPISIEGCAYDQIRDAVAATVKAVEGLKVVGPSGLEPIQYPTETLHETIANAVLHRDYSLNDDVHVRVFDNRIEVESPGSLPAHITVANILTERFARNPTMVRVINRFPNPPNKDVGEGLNTAFDAMKKLGLKPPRIEARPFSVLCSIRHERLARPEELIMEYLDTHTEINNKIVRELAGIGSENTVKRIFQGLMEVGELERVPGKEGNLAAYQKKGLSRGRN